MKSPLSLNTQLSKLRLVNNLLKQTLSEAVCEKDNGFKDTSRCTELNQVIYSLRDIQYNLRGLDYTAKRSSQTRKMNILEIRKYLKSEIESDAKCGPLYKTNLQKIYIELNSVEQFLQLKENFVSTPTISNNIEKDELF